MYNEYLRCWLTGVLRWVGVYVWSDRIWWWLMGWCRGSNILIISTIGVNLIGIFLNLG